MPMREATPAGRVEVFTGAGRRREWSAEDKARIVAESYGGSESVSSVARRHGLTASQLFSWRRAADKAKPAQRDKKEAAFAPVMLSHELASHGRHQPFQLDDAIIEIVIGAIAVRVGHGVDMARLAAVLRTVKLVDA
jgi:transposase